VIIHWINGLHIRNTSHQYALGLDFGGTKLAAGIVDVKSLTLVDSAFQSTDAESGAAGAVADMIALAKGLKCVDQITRIGISFGGYARNNQILKSLHVSGWDNYPIHDPLRQHFGDLPIFVANDANAVALGEWKFGAGRGVDSMLFLTVSTGVGGGIILNGQLLEGTNGIAGEIGHVNAIPENGPPCTCGHYGCVEAVSSGPSMVKRAHVLLAAQPDVSSELRALPTFTARDLDVLAQKGDLIARQALLEGARYLGIAIGNAINLLDVSRVVIGGGVSRSGPLWWEMVRNAAAKIVLPWRPPVTLVPSELGTHEGIWGAIALLPGDETGISANT
jgi:glucokinase